MQQLGSLSAGWQTHPGQVREQNEDACISPSETEQAVYQRGYLFAVADGMGGYSGGQDASTVALQTLYEQFYTAAATDVQSVLGQAVQAANMAVRRMSMQPGQDTRMGTTLVAVVFHQHIALVAHVGDSRAYQVRQGTITQMTVDHSVVQERVLAGELSAEQARAFPGKNVLTRSLGSKSTVQADYAILSDLAPNDIFVLCSDGLSNQVTDAEIAQVVSQMQPDEAAQTLTSLANERGGPDNITVIVVQINALPFQVNGSMPSPDEQHHNANVPHKSWLPWRLSLLIAALVLVLTLVGVWIFLLPGWWPFGPATPASLL